MARGDRGRRSKRRDDASVSDRFGIDGDDAVDNINVFGLQLPNPLVLIRGDLGGPSNTISPTKIVLYGGIVAILGASLFDTFLRQKPFSVRGAAAASGVEDIQGSALPHVTSDGKYHGRYPNSLLTLFYPFTLFRDVVLDQPIDVNDVPFYWHAHVSDERAVKRVLTSCYGADLVELDDVEDIEKAKKLDLVGSLVAQNRLGGGAMNTGENFYNGQRRRPLIITSPHIREAAELFTQNNYGRMFSFYRHPIDYDVHPKLKKKLPPEAGANNFLTRLLSDVHTGPLGFKELGIAKQVVRQVTVSGTRDLMPESLFRIGKYFGWIPVGGSGTKADLDKDDNIAKECIETQLASVPGERYADHNSPEWQVFYNANRMDCQLYELGRSTWRAQIQTVISLTLQKTRAGEGDDEDEDEEGGDGGGRLR